MFRKIKNNKLRNTGLIFQILIRRISSQLLECNEQKKAIKLLSKIFNKNSQIVKQLNIYKSLSEYNQQIKNQYNANKFIDIILQNRIKNIDQKKLISQKYNAIRLIEQNYDSKQFFSTNIKKYKQHSSVYKLIQSYINSNKYKPIQHINNRQYVLQNILNKQQNSLNQIQILTKQPKQVRQLANQIMIKEFNKKYQSLSNKQKKLLKLYINQNIQNKKQFTIKFKQLTLQSCKNIISIINKKVLHQLDSKKVVNTVQIIRQKISNYKFISEQNVKMLVNLFQLQNQIQNLKDNNCNE